MVGKPAHGPLPIRESLLMRHHKCRSRNLLAIVSPCVPAEGFHNRRVFVRRVNRDGVAEKILASIVTALALALRLPRIAYAGDLYVYTLGWLRRGRHFTGIGSHTRSVAGVRGASRRSLDF